VVCVHTTVSLDDIRDLAELAEPHGVIVLDAGISGGEPGAAKGTLLTMVGGADDALERARPVLDTYSKEVLHAGPLGTGMALKLARNATSFAFMAVVHEALTMADRAGVDLAMLRHTLSTTGLFEQALTPIGLGAPAPLPADAPATMRATLEHAVAMADKDLDQAIRLATDLGVPSDFFTRTRDGFAAVMRVG
jgi:3-hydroxyisobutyrate dehydrogenase-like beta-hydroxyacid dehydrogenase